MLVFVRFSPEGPSHSGVGEGDQYHTWWRCRSSEKISVRGLSPRTQQCRESSLERDSGQSEGKVQAPLARAHAQCYEWSDVQLLGFSPQEGALLGFA